MSQYVVVIDTADDGTYGAWSPDLPGCVALGKSTHEECLAEIRQAIASHLEDLRSTGQPVPTPSGADIDLIESR